MPLTLAEVLKRIRDPELWVDRDAMVRLIQDNPSFRSFAYGYTAEHHFLAYLSALDIHESYKDDDHDRSSKADRTFIFGAKEFTVQLKSFQTHTIREIGEGQFSASIQNDASDSRPVELPNGDRLKTACYIVGQYHILAVTLYAFEDTWTFAFKKNKDLRRSTYRGYTEEQRRYLLATLEPFTYPIPAESGWTMNLLSLLDDPDLGRARVVATTPDREIVAVDTPETHERVIIEEPSSGDDSLNHPLRGTSAT